MANFTKLDLKQVAATISNQLKQNKYLVRNDDAFQNIPNDNALYFTTKKTEKGNLRLLTVTLDRSHDLIKHGMALIKAVRHRNLTILKKEQAILTPFIHLILDFDELINHNQLVIIGFSYSGPFNVLTNNGPSMYYNRGVSTMDDKLCIHQNYDVRDYKSGKTDYYDHGESNIRINVTTDQFIKIKQNIQSQLNAIVPINISDIGPTLTVNQGSTQTVLSNTTAHSMSWKIYNNANATINIQQYNLDDEPIPELIYYQFEVILQLGIALTTNLKDLDLLIDKHGKWTWSTKKSEKQFICDLLNHLAIATNMQVFFDEHHNFLLSFTKQIMITANFMFPVKHGNAFGQNRNDDYILLIETLERRLSDSYCINQKDLNKVQKPNIQKKLANVKETSLLFNKPSAYPEIIITDQLTPLDNSDSIAMLLVNKNSVFPNKRYIVTNKNAYMFHYGLTDSQIGLANVKIKLKNFKD